MEDLEEGYSDSEVEIAEFPEDDMDDADVEGGVELDEDDFAGLESGDDAMLDDDDDLPSDFEGIGADEDEEEEVKDKKTDEDGKKKKKRKLKHLPTFASADDYAAMLDADDVE